MTPEDSAPVLAAPPSADVAAQPSADAAVPHPCPRCGLNRGSETRLLCSACWGEAPEPVRKRWVGALLAFQRRHPVALFLLTWARPEAPPPERGPRPPKKKPQCGVSCSQCRRVGPKPSRRDLAQQLRDILPLGTPVKVRERAELVARRLSGWCEACAAVAQATKKS